MKKRRLPPLNALRAFEATARHLSVKQAADELCVTPGAVSQLLKTLEHYLGVPLFRRVNRGVFLTEAGQGYLPPIRNAFRQIAEATRRIDQSDADGAFPVSVTPLFASAWLVPRLSGFQSAHPDIDLHVRTSQALADFVRDGVDIAVRHGLGRYPGLCSHRVLTMEVVPVAAPMLLTRLGTPAMPAGLAHWPLLHDAERAGWHHWFQAQGVTEIGTARGTAFDDSGVLLQAALAGQGAGLLPLALVAGELADGQLVKLADPLWLEQLAYYLVYPESSHDRPKVAAFRTWMLATANDDGERSAGLPSSTGVRTAGRPRRNR